MKVQAILASSYNPIDLQKVVNIVADLESKLNQI
jgi:hypothetical protein